MLSSIAAALEGAFIVVTGDVVSYEHAAMPSVVASRAARTRWRDMEQLQSEGTFRRSHHAPAHGADQRAYSYIRSQNRTRPTVPVDVIACLPPDLLTRLRQALDVGHRVLAVDEWTQVRSAWEGSRDATLVLDPREAPAESLSLSWADGIPTVLYTAFTPSAMRLVLAASAEMGGTDVEVALRGQDDSPAHIRSMVDRTSASALAERLAQLIGLRLSEVPEPIGIALLAAVRTPLRFRNVEDLAAATGYPQHTLRRWSRRATIGSPKRLLTAGRILWAYYYLRVRSATVRDIVERLGYESQRDLARHVRQLIGTTIMGLRQLDEPTLLNRLHGRVCP